jgi:conjugal transfer mating pair stabilization protein TraN
MASITFLTLSGLSYAQDTALKAVDVFPVNQSVLDSTDAPISVIETAEIADSQGRVARGPHDVVFSLTDDAPYAIKIGGKRIEPGSSITLTIDLTRVGHRLQMPVFPAESGKYGKVDYKMSIPNLNIKICPDGFQERPEDCYKIEFLEINYICPASFTYNSNLEACRRQVNLELVNDCPDGFSRGSGDTCTRTTTAETVEYCADDTMSVEGDSCIKRTYSDTMACPETYSRDDSGRCSKVTNSEPTQSCPENFTKVGNSCQRLTQAEPTDWSCPSSHPNRAEDSESCFATQSGFEEFGSAESELSCAAGYTFEDSRCVQYTEPTYQCSRGGYNTETGACEYTVILPESDYCGSVEVQADMCPVNEYAEIGVYCKTGFDKQSDNSCMKLESAPIQNKCQSGYSMNDAGTACVKSETLTLDIKCPSGYARSDNGAYCYKTDQMNAYQNCATGYTNVGGGVCEKVESKTADPACPSGYSLRNGSCEKEQSQTASALCEEGTLSGGKCQVIESRSSDKSCDPGYKYNPWQSRCCPDDGEGCTLRGRDAEESCKADEEKVEAVFSLGGDYKCEKTVEKEPVYSCDSGWTLSGSTCRKTTTVSAAKQCSSGWTLSNGKCKRTLTADVNYSCPSDDKWTLNNTKCDFYDEDPLVISCPDTFTYNSSTDACERVDTQPAILGCADGFSLTEDETQCFRETIVPHL